MIQIGSSDKMAIIQLLTRKDCKIEFNEPKHIEFMFKDKLVKSETLVPFYPLKDKVLIKATFEENLMIIKSVDDIKKTNPVSQIVVGIGPETHGLKLGDKVKVSFSSTIEPISLPGNDKGIKEMKEIVESKEFKIDPLTDGKKKLTMIEFYIVPIYAVVGIFE